jgi:hypothetical protein
MNNTIQVQSISAGTSSPSAAKIATVVSIAGLVGIFGYLLIYHFHHEQVDHGRHLGDFPTFYEAAQLARDHHDIYTAGPPKQKYVYPPLIAFLYVPLTSLPRVTAAHVSLFVNSAVLLASLLLIADTMVRRMNVRGSVLPVVVAFGIAILNENEMRLQLTMLETDALMLLMFVLALRWLDRAPIAAGVALAFAFNIKYLPVIVLPYLILHRRWKVVGAMALGSVFFALLPALLFGWREDLRCLSVSFGGLLKWVHAPDAGYTVEVHDIGDTLSLSITSAIGRMMTAHGQSNLVTMLAAACIGAIALGLVAALFRLNGFSLWGRRPGTAAAVQPRDALVALEWAGLITVALAFSPDTNARHLLLAVIVNAAAVTLLLIPSRVNKIPVLASIVIIFLSFIMPGVSIRTIYYHYGVPCWVLLGGYLLILGSGLTMIRQSHEMGAANSSGR